MKTIAFNAAQLLIAYYRLAQAAHYWSLAANTSELATCDVLSDFLFASVDDADDLITLAQNARDAAQRDCYTDRDYTDAPAYFAATADHAIEEVDGDHIDDRPTLCVRQQRIYLVDCKS